MHIIHNIIGTPKIYQEIHSENYGKFILSPLPRGYGVTLGNSLRRILLSSIPWAKVTWVKIHGVSHEYSTIQWIKDTVLDIMLNLKWLVIEKATDEIEWIKIKKSKAWKVTGNDIQCPIGIKVLNKDLYITEIDIDGIELEMDIRVEKWVGYLSLEDLKKREEDVEVLLIDAHFSPIVRVEYHIEKTRFWDITDLDSLELHIISNGSMKPAYALDFASRMLVSYFSLFLDKDFYVEKTFIQEAKWLLEEEKRIIKEELEKEPYTPIEILGLSPRTLNALINGNILSVEQLTKCSETKLSSIKWFWKKAMTEIKQALEQRGLKLLWE